MERFWNYIHSSIFYFANFIFSLLSKLDPFNYILRIPFIVKMYEKRGILNPAKQVDDIVFRNKETGWLSIWSGIQMGGMLVLLQYSIFNLIQAILGKSLIQYVWEDSLNKWIFLIGLLVMPAIINYYLLWKEDKYLTYFKEFEKESKEVKRKWAWISFTIVLGIILILIASYWIMILGLNRE